MLGQGTNLHEQYWQGIKDDLRTMGVINVDEVFTRLYDDKLEAYPYSDYYPVDATRFINGSSKALTQLKDGAIDVSTANATYGLNIEKPTLDPESSFVIAHQFESFTPTTHYYAFYNPFWENPHALQYWFYYTNNDWAGDHIGDWEGISIFFDKDETPIEANYSTHLEARKYPWSGLQVSGKSPTVYVSHGGHGSYGIAGTTSYASFTGLVNDNHGGNTAGGVGRFVLDAKDLANTDVLRYEPQWGSDKKSPLGPKWRTDDKQEALGLGGILATNAENPYKDCQYTETLNIFGQGEELPDYENQKGIDDSKKEALIEKVTDFGPWRWASGYFYDEDCDSDDVIDKPEKVNGLALSQSGDDITLEWQTDLAASSRPFGYTLSAYRKDDINNKKHAITPHSTACDDKGVCTGSINLTDYGLAGSDLAELCVAVTAWNPAGDKGEEALCLKPNFAIVVDDTGSMSEEINTIKAQLVNAVANASKALKEPPIFHLVTFKDWAAHRLISADTDKVIDAIGNLYASGGGNCPESAGSGLLMAANEIVDKGRLIWATDAKANDLTVAARARNILADKSVSITTLLSGDCRETDGKSLKMSGKSQKGDLRVVEKIDQGDTGEQAPSLQKGAVIKPRKLTKKSKDEAFRSFDGLDWEADDGLTNGVPVLTGYREGFLPRYIGFDTKWGNDKSDMFSIYLNPGIYEIRVEVPSVYNSGQYIQAQLYDRDGNTVGSGGYSTYRSTYTVTVDSSKAASWFALQVTLRGSVTDTPIKYRVFVEESPYAFMTTRKALETLTNGLGGNYYFVLEIKRGDDTRFSEAVAQAFAAAFSPEIASVNGELSLGQRSILRVQLKNGTWSAGDTISASIALPRSAATGCYSISAVVGGATLNQSCALRVSGATAQEPQQVPAVNLWGLLLLMLATVGMVVRSRK